MALLGTLGSLNVLLSADTAQFSSAMEKAAYTAEKNLNKIGLKSKISSAAIITAITAISTAIAVSIKKTIDYADELVKTSQSLGIPVEALSKLKYAADLSGVSFDELKSAVVKMGKATSENASFFKALGVEINNTDGSVRNSYDILSDLSEVISRMPDGIDKTNIIIKLFGKNAANLVPLLNSGKKGLKELASEAEKLGIVIDSNTALAAENFNDNMERLASVSKGLITSFTSGIIPTLANLTEGISGSAEALASFRQAGQDVATILVTLVNTGTILAGIFLTIVDTLTTAATQIYLLSTGKFKEAMNVGGAYLEDQKKRWENIITGITKNWNALIDTTIEGSSNTNRGISDVSDSIENLNKKQEEGRALTESLRTAQEKYDDEIAKYNALRKDNIITEETYERAVKKARETLDKSTESTSKLKDAARDLGFTFQSAFEDALLEGKKLSEVLSSLLQDIERIIIRKAITEPLANAIGDFFSPASTTPSAHGNIFSGNRLIPFLNGGLINRPTLFPMANGGLGLAGEAGDEAIMPLFRGSNGDLGVKSNGGGGGVEINIYAPEGSKVSQNRQTIGDKEQINIMIDEAVAGSVKDSGSKTHRALKSSFGLKQSLTVR
ncbi:MAG TPA: hypothetical protein PLC32_07190 [Candidatus Omnitrophota bacterium]|nr:hypothetical protein [Candidatus Omnitrophota bacterium]